MRDDAVCQRFGLRHGQFFAKYRFKNLHWFLNGKEFGFGDLRSIDILNIHDRLNEDDVFEGFNEHHMTQYMQRENPVVRINYVEIEYPPAVPVTNETRIKIKEACL